MKISPLHMRFKVAYTMPIPLVWKVVFIAYSREEVQFNLSYNSDVGMLNALTSLISAYLIVYTIAYRKKKLLFKSSYTIIIHIA